jgi:hypothetical protein
MKIEFRIKLSKIDWLTDWLLALTGTVLLGSVSHRTHDHILLSDGSAYICNFLIIDKFKYVVGGLLLIQ